MRPLPWLAIAGDGTARLALGPRWGGLRLLAVGPAIASAADGMLVTVAAGMASLAVYLAFVLTAPGRPRAWQPVRRDDGGGHRRCHGRMRSRQHGPPPPGG